MVSAAGWRDFTLQIAGANRLLIASSLGPLQLVILMAIVVIVFAPRSSSQGCRGGCSTQRPPGRGSDERQTLGAQKWWPATACCYIREPLTPFWLYASFLFAAHLEAARVSKLCVFQRSLHQHRHKLAGALNTLSHVNLQTIVSATRRLMSGEGCRSPTVARLRQPEEADWNRLSRWLRLGCHVFMLADKTISEI